MKLCRKAVMTKRIKIHILRVPNLVYQKHLNYWMNLMEFGESASTFSVHCKWLSIQGCFTELNHEQRLLCEDEKAKK